MLPKKHRLAKTKDIQRVLAKGRNFFNPHFTIRILPATTPLSRFTVVVSSKTAKLAVRRNRLKRMIRPWLKNHLNSLKTGDYMIIVKSKTASLPDDQVIKQLHSLLSEKKLLI
jgi:ribonuclease P protein component